jgi:hypothetical protein
MKIKEKKKTKKVNQLQTRLRLPHTSTRDGGCQDNSNVALEATV